GADRDDRPICAAAGRVRFREAHQRDRVLATATRTGRGAQHRAGGGRGPTGARGGSPDSDVSSLMSAALPLDVQCTHRAPLRAEGRRRMAAVLAISAVVMLVEAVGGWLAHSLALLADAGHMLADGAALRPPLGV